MNRARSAVVDPPPEQRTSAVAPKPTRASLSGIVSTIVSWHAPLAFSAAAMGLVAVVSAVGLLVDDRILVGAPIWAKALKFAISFAVYSLTLGWMISMIQRPRLRRVARRAGTALAIAALLEVVAMVTQIVRGTLSHFNVATTFDTALFAAMGGLISIIFVAALLIAIAITFTPMSDIALTWSIRLGALVSILGLSTGFLMLRSTPDQIAQGDDAPTQGAHSVGVTDGGPSIPILGWSATGGDIRVSHFVGMHALQVLPLLAIVLLAYFGTRMAARTRLQLVVVSSISYAAVFALVLWQALRGQALTSPDAWTVGGAIAIIVATAVAVLAIRVSGLARRSTPSVFTPTPNKNQEQS